MSQSIITAGAYGVHAPSATSYRNEQLEDWLRGCGLGEATEAPAAIKLYGLRPEPSTQQLRFIAAAQRLGMRLVVHWCAWEKNRPGPDSQKDWTESLRVGAREIAERFPGAILCGPINEPGQGSWIGSEDELLEADAAVGQVWSAMLREWAPSPRASQVTALAVMPDWLEGLRVRGAVPSHWFLHLYGRGNDEPRHVPLFQAAVDSLGLGVRKPKILVEEYHYGHPPHGAAPDAMLLSAGAGAFCWSFAQAFAQAGWLACLFTLDMMVPDPTAAEYPEATKAFWMSTRRQIPYSPPLEVPSPRESKEKAYRLLTEHRSWFSTLSARLTLRDW